MKSITLTKELRDLITQSLKEMLIIFVKPDYDQVVYPKIDFNVALSDSIKHVVSLSLALEEQEEKGKAFYIALPHEETIARYFYDLVKDSFTARILVLDRRIQVADADSHILDVSESTLSSALDYRVNLVSELASEQLTNDITGRNDKLKVDADLTSDFEIDEFNRLTKEASAPADPDSGKEDNSELR